VNTTEQLRDFVRQSLEEGHDRAAIAGAMADAGWSEAEVRTALAAWAKPQGMPPVPLPQHHVSAREAVFHALMFAALAMVTWHLLQLGFAVIDALIPDLTDLSVGRGTMRWSIAALLGFLPLFLYLDRRAVRAVPRGEGGRGSSLRRLFASVTLLIALLTLMGDLVAAIYALLSGGLTLRFIAKAVLVAVIAGLVLVYYRSDLDD
jgi:hypothetical protein